LNETRQTIPCIEIILIIDYDPAMSDLGLLSEFIVDLNPDCHEAKIVLKFQLQDGKIDDFFDGFTDYSPSTIQLFLKEL
jgi:putative ATP-dependent endonuclease of the OLD family